MRFASLEELNDETIGTEVDSELVDLPENDIIAAGEAGDEAVSIAEGVDATSVAADRLEDLAETVEETTAEGGLSDTEAEVVRQAAESLALIARLPMTAATRKMPSTESFGTDKEARIRSTKLTAEGFKETATKWKEAVVSAIKRMIDAIAKFFDFTGKAAVKLQARAKALVSSANNVSGTQADKVKSNAALNDGSKPLTGDALISSYEKLAALKLFDKAQLDASTKAIVALTELTGKGEAADKEAIRKAFEATTEALYHGPLKEGAGEVALPFGGNTLHIDAPKGSDDDFKTRLLGIGGTKVAIRAAKDAKKVESSEVAPLTSEQVKKLAGAVATHMKTYDDLVTAVKAVKAASDKAIKEITSTKDANKTASSGLRGLTSALVSGAYGVRGFDVRVSKAALDFSDTSLKAYGKKEAAKA